MIWIDHFHESIQYHKRGFSILNSIISCRVLGHHFFFFAIGLYILQYLKLCYKQWFLYLFLCSGKRSETMRPLLCLTQSINQSKISYLGRKNYVAKMCTNGYHIFVYHSNFFQKFIVWNLNCILYSELFVCWLLHRDTLSLHAWKNNKFGFNRLLSRLLL